MSPPSPGGGGIAFDGLASARVAVPSQIDLMDTEMNGAAVLRRRSLALAEEAIKNLVFRVLRGSGTMVLASVVLLMLGVTDFLTGHHFALSAFYLIPISLGGWARGRKAGLMFAALSAALWLVADLLTRHAYPHPVIPYWNALTLLVLFVVVALLLSAVRSANTHLEETVKRRTAALEAAMAERQRLEEAHLQGERLAMVGTIASQVAHEVRNPLRSITLNLDLVAKEIARLSETGHSPGQEGLALVNEIREEVRRIRRVIDDYLRFARLPKLKAERLNLNSFLAQKLAFMVPVFQEARVQLRMDWDEGLSTVEGDGEQIWQAILNMVQNSLEAMPDGGILAVATRRGKGQALVTVTDSGKGMNPEQLGQVFVPFFTTKPRGTGLGLTLAQRILNEHGAQLECASTIGHGTSFTIRLPLKEAA
jgi:signal transduction histidine kinase